MNVLRIALFGVLSVVFGGDSLLAFVASASPARCGSCSSSLTLSVEDSENSIQTDPKLQATTVMTSHSLPESSPGLQILGVCGGIGSGKSTACRLLVSECNCLEHLDADSMAHSVYAPGSQAVKDVVAEFGSNILVEKDESRMEIDRKKLGTVVFADRSAMARLERIVWPHVKALITHRIDGIRQQWKTEQEQNSKGAKNLERPIVILEAAVLLDAEWNDFLDGVWVITAPREIALQRLMETRGLSQEEAEKRINAQESRRGIGNLQHEIVQEMVTGVIENKGGLDELTLALTKALDDPSFWKRR